MPLPVLLVALLAPFGLPDFVCSMSFCAIFAQSVTHFRGVADSILAASSLDLIHQTMPISQTIPMRA